MATFRTKARAVDLLGRNQIADLPTAITELWKNGYDAYGDYLSASLYKSGYEDYPHNIFIISDDGHGMSKDDLENKWIVLGTDSKRNKRSMVPDEDRFGKQERIPLGEKGIGRLSVTYLGSHMLMITKKVNLPFEMLFMNWGVLDNYELYLDEVNIPISSFEFLEDMPIIYNKLVQQFKDNFRSKSWNDFKDEKDTILKEAELFKTIPNYVIDKIEQHYEKYQHGTIFIIFNPIEEIVQLEEWGNETDKYLKEQLESQATYIKSALAALFNPFDIRRIMERRKNIIDVNSSPSFYIYKPNQEPIDFLTNSDFYTLEEFYDCEHWIDGNFDEFGCFKGKIKVFGNIEDYLFNPQRKKQKTKFGEIVLKVAFWEGTPNNSTLPRQKWDIYESKTKFAGLYVYRDGFRVLPYGRTDMDFLDFEFRRSKGTGFYYFSYRKMIGYIGITKDQNPKLIDKSGREGFVSNAAYREMKEILKEFFIHIAKERYGTQSKIRKDVIERLKKEKDAERLRKQETDRNASQIKELRKKIRANENELFKIEKRLRDISKEIEEKTIDDYISQKQSRYLSIEIQNSLISLNILNVVPNASLSFAGYDREYDMYYDYEGHRSAIIKTAQEVMKKIEKYTYINTLKDVYKDKYMKMNGIIEKEYSEILNEFQNQLDYIQQKFKDIFEAWKVTWYKFSPGNIDIENLTVEETQDYIKKIDEMYNVKNQIFSEKLEPFVERFKNLDFDNRESALLSAYKDVEVNLGKQLENFYELAQVGMSIEIIDHQFNVLYNQMNQSIRALSSGLPENSSLQKNMSAFKTAFQHLESNHKMLMPLYRTTRRNKKEIKGSGIEDTINSFYNKIMKDNNIDFQTTIEFKSWSYYTYESMITPVFINIVNNAVYWVRLVEYRKIVLDYDSDRDEVLIMNSGPKMSETETKRCFELFYSKKPSGRGIGLYLAKKNLQAIDLDIFATNDNRYNQLNGACFVICKYIGESRV